MQGDYTQTAWVILSSISIGFFFVEVWQLPYRFKWSNRKPFNCVPCFSGWVALGWSLSFPVCMVTLMAATIFIKLYKKYL